MKIFTSMRRSFALLKGRRLAYLLTSIGNAFMNLFNGFINSWAITQLVNDGTAPVSFERVLSLILICVGAELIYSASRYLIGLVYFRFSHKLRTDLCATVNALPMTVYDKEHSGTFLTYLKTDIDHIEDVFRDYIGVASPLFTIIGSIATIFVWQWRFGLIYLVIAAVVFTFKIRSIKPMQKIAEETVQSQESLNALELDILHGVREIKLFSLAPLMIKRFSRQCSRLLDTIYRRIRLNLKLNLAVQGMSQSAFFIILVFGLFLNRAGIVEMGIVLGSAIFVSNYTWTYSALPDEWMSLIQNLVSVDRFWNFIHQKKESDYWAEYTERVSGSPVERHERPGIHIRGLSYGYSEGTDIFHGYDIDIPSQKTVAIVGETGAGKSTLLKVLSGLYIPRDGTIAYNGAYMHESSVSAWRSQFFYLPQEPTIFPMTIAENIAVCCPDATYEEVVLAAQKAHIHEVIEKLPDGYQTVIGEGGATLSGGEQQRIAVARAFLSRQPVLIMDEPTASLDNENTAIVESSLSELMKDEKKDICIIITHNPSLAAKADLTLSINRLAKVKES